jgi:hypothetical protein
MNHIAAGIISLISLYLASGPTPSIQCAARPHIALRREISSISAIRKKNVQAYQAALRGGPASAGLRHVIFSRKASGEQTIFTYYQRCIYVRMRVNEQDDQLFLLDTGANVSALDIRAAERLKIAVTGIGKVEGTTGVLPVNQARIRRLSIAGASAADLQVTAQDLRGSLAPPGRTLDGIVGYDFLRHFAVRIDFTKRTIAFARKPGRVSAWDTKTLTCIRFKIDNGIPRLKALLNMSVTADYRLDTGASLFDSANVYVNVTQGTWEQLQAKDPNLVPQRFFTGTGPGGEVKLPVSRIQSLSVGTIVVTAPYVIVQPRAGYFVRKDAIGFLSNNFLEKYSPVIVDYLNKTLYLSQPDKISAAQPPADCTAELFNRR